MRNMLRFLKGYEKESILAPLFKMLEACFELLVPLVVANIIDVGIKNGDLAYIGKQCGLMVLLAVVGMASSLTAQYFAAKAALGYGTALRGALFRHIDTLSYTELDGIGTPTLVTRMTSDVNQLQNGVNMTLRLLLRCPFIVIGALILAFVISPTMGFWFVLVTLAISLVVWLIMRVTVPQYRAAQNTLDKVTLLTRENYVGARVVRAFARQDDEIADFTAVNDKLKTFQLTAGRNFSGGPRQRLTIARALVPHPQVLILDDSSSALDFATDAALRKALKEQTHGMTVFIVSQRASAVQRADRILVLDDGNLVGSGTHANLLKTCDVYREICLSQLSREEVEKTL